MATAQSTSTEHREQPEQPEQPEQKGTKSPHQKIITTKEKRMEKSKDSEQAI